jgi:hypothetical protein
LRERVPDLNYQKQGGLNVSTKTGYLTRVEIVLAGKSVAPRGFKNNGTSVDRKKKCSRKSNLFQLIFDGGEIGMCETFSPKYQRPLAA